MQLTSLSLALTRAGFLSFSPASLFAAGEPGVWYDPSDFSTMFQDSAGTTPVTAVGQPVGLILDKSKGLVLGPELVTNGDFSSGTTGWTPGAGWSIAGGTAIANTTFGSDLLTSSSNWLGQNGKSYLVTATITMLATPDAMAAVAINIGGTGQHIFVSSQSNLQAGQSYSIRGIAQPTSVGAGSFLIRVGSNLGLNYALNYTIDNISVRELPGNHATQTTSTSRPVLSARVNLLTKTEQFDDAAWSKVGATVSANATAAPDGSVTADKLVENTGAGSHYTSFSGGFTTVSGAQYIYSLYCKAGERNWLFFESFGNVTAGTAYVNLTTGATGAATGGLVGLSVTNAGSGWWKISTPALTGSGGTGNIEWRIATANGTNSYTGDGTSGIYIWGASLVPANQANLPYQRVNTATDYDITGFPLYLKFDGVDDFLVTNSINFTATDKMTVFAGVRKLSDASSVIAEFSADYANSGAFGLFCEGSPGSAKNYEFGSKGTVLSRIIASPFASPITNVLTGLGNISGDSAILRVNGTQAASSTADQGTGNYGNYPLYIGRRAGTSLPFNGYIYSLIVRGAQSNTGQIASTETWVNGKTGAY